MNLKNQLSFIKKTGRSITIIYIITAHIIEEEFLLTNRIRVVDFQIKQTLK
jgi:hypothetical protein